MKFSTLFKIVTALGWGLCGQTVVQANEVFYLQFFGTSASGTYQGRDYTSMPWSMEMTVPFDQEDQNSNDGYGRYSVTDTRLSLLGVEVPLHSSSKNNIFSVSEYEYLGETMGAVTSTNDGYGGFGRIWFASNNDLVEGTLFNDVDDLDTFMGGTLSNTSVEAPILNFVSGAEYEDYSDTQLFLANEAGSFDGVMDFTVYSEAGEGSMWVRVSLTSMMGAGLEPWENWPSVPNPSAVPEPSSYAAFLGMIALGVTGWRRRRIRTP